MMPDGHGGARAYECDTVWRLLITSVDLQRLLYLGFEPKRLKLEYHRPQRSAHQFVQVVAVEDRERRDDTYCFNEPIRHMGVFNGILTGNCTEITLPTGIDQHGRDRTAVCCLSSLNLGLPNNYVERLKAFPR
jgi:ribonucleoside-diphosphate reductase alpha chain